MSVGPGSARRGDGSCGLPSTSAPVRSVVASLTQAVSREPFPPRETPDGPASKTPPLQKQRGRSPGRLPQGKVNVVIWVPEPAPPASPGPVKLPVKVSGAWPFRWTVTT